MQNTYDSLRSFRDIYLTGSKYLVNASRRKFINKLMKKITIFANVLSPISIISIHIMNKRRRIYYKFEDRYSIYGKYRSCSKIIITFSVDHTDHELLS